MNRITNLAAAGVIGFATSLVTIGAQAHVTIWPRESMSGATERYTVRVPTEGDVMTIGAEMEVPAGVVIEVLSVPNGWTHEITRSGERITAINWSMDIGPGEFAEFGFVARNPRDETRELVWTLRQLFADGTVTDWTMGPNGVRPTAVTTLVPRP
jgi:uncharacterized protein YcnI